MANDNNYENTSIEKDDDLNIEDLIHNSENSEETSAGATEAEAPAEPEEEKSPLQIMKEEKEKHRGIEINKADFDDGTPKPLKDVTQSPETEQGVDEAIKEMDAMINVLEKNPIKGAAITDPQQRMDVVNAISNIAKNNPDAENVDIRKEAGLVGENTDSDTLPEYAGEDDDEPENEEEPSEPMSESKAKLVNILIDKTGLGQNIVLSDEEKAKLETATRIKITEVDTKSIETATYKKHNDGSYDSITRAYQISSISTPITLPASRYTARMKGLSFGEMGDIAVNPEHMTFEQLNKKLSVIYHNMINPSIGEFKSYDDFLKNTAYVDIEMCMFGLACSTLPENDTITLRCTRRNCGKEYDVTYSPRALIQFEDMSEDALKAINDITSASSPEAIAAEHEKSSLANLKAIRLPASGFIVELGLASAYDFLHGISALILGDGLKNIFPDDVNGMKAVLSSFLTFTRSVSIPCGDGSYDKFTGPEDIVQALYDLKQDDITIMVALAKKYSDAYNVSFAITDVACPHCGTKTKKVPLDIANLVFTKYQTLGNTEIDLDAITVI